MGNNDNTLVRDEKEAMTSTKPQGDNEVLEEFIEDTTKKKDLAKEDEPLTMQVLLFCARSPQLGDLPLEDSRSGCNVPLDANAASS